VPKVPKRILEALPTIGTKRLGASITSFSVSWCTRYALPPSCSTVQQLLPGRRGQPENTRVDNSWLECNLLNVHPRQCRNIALDMGNFDVEYPIINVPSAGTGLTQHRKSTSIPRPSDQQGEAGEPSTRADAHRVGAVSSS
jgi:hypothetical protein